MEQRNCYAEQIYGLLKKLALADGDLSRAEAQWLDLLVDEVEPAIPYDEFILGLEVASEGQAEQIVLLMLQVGLADNEISGPEWELIYRTARMLGVADSVVTDYYNSLAA